MSRRLDHKTCEETFRRLDDYLDRQLSPEETRMVEDHLRICAMCAGEFSFEAGVIEAVRDKLRRMTAPPDLLARIVAQINRTPPQE